jgi:hypothetical protein
MSTERYEGSGTGVCRRPRDAVDASGKARAANSRARGVFSGSGALRERRAIKLRIGEALALRWQHVDLGTGTLYVVDAKTAKGVREVHLSPALREALTIARADRDPEPSAYVIATSTGRKHNPSNLRRDVLVPAVKAANVSSKANGLAPIGRVTFHSLRRSYASLRCACGDDVRYTADQLGHEDPRFTLRVYAQATKRRDRLTGPHLKAYDRALEWALMGTSEPLTVPALDAEATKSPGLSSAAEKCASSCSRKVHHRGWVELVSAAQAEPRSGGA